MNETNNNSLNYFDFVFTNDKSVGLYNHNVKDIYHSSYGAKNEAIEKFIHPLNIKKNFINKKNLKVLDICYGIGYNTKALISELIKNKYQGKTEIDILEYDKNLVLISPFVRDGFFDSHPEISYILSSSLIDKIQKENEVIKNLFIERNKKFITPYYWRLIKKYRQLGYNYNPYSKNKTFLHNIYYHCISHSYKKAAKRLKFKNFLIKAYFSDARDSIKTLKSGYDIIFLDAFTPVKLPTLWSIDFFSYLFKLISDDGVIVTYSNSAAVRNAMLNVGFNVGKIYDKSGRASGTIATKNKSLIEYPLNNYDLGLLQTNAGVYFKDINLSQTPDEILEEWTQRKIDLNLESSSHYIKTHRGK